MVIEEVQQAPRRRWWDRRGAVLAVSSAEQEALRHVGWAEIVAAADAEDRDELRALRARWRATFDAPDGRIVLEPGLCLSIARYVEQARADRWARERQREADVLIGLVDRVVALAVTSPR